MPSDVSPVSTCSAVCGSVRFDLSIDALAWVPVGLVSTAEGERRCGCRRPAVAVLSIPRITADSLQFFAATCCFGRQSCSQHLTFEQILRGCPIGRVRVVWAACHEDLVTSASRPESRVCAHCHPCCTRRSVCSPGKYEEIALIVARVGCYRRAWFQKPQPHLVIRRDGGSSAAASLSHGTPRLAVARSWWAPSIQMAGVLISRLATIQICHSHVIALMGPGSASGAAVMGLPAARR